MQPVLLVFFILLAQGVFSQAHAQSQLYWADANIIWRGNADGTDIEVIQTGIDSLTAIAFDANEHKLYWSTQKQIWRADLTGDHPELFYSGKLIRDIDIDAQTRTLYFAPPLMRLNLDTKQVDTLSTRLFTRFAIDTQNQKLYGIVDNAIYSIPTSETASNPNLRPHFNVGSMDDLIYINKNERIYWLDAQEGAIRYGNTLGIRVVTILNAELENVRGLVVDTDDQKMYWTTKSIPSSTVSTLYMANTDGTSIRELSSVSSQGGWVKDMVLYYPASANLSFGDVNNDGSIDSADAILVLRGSIQLEQLTPEQEIRADVNGDQTIDSRDATLILRKIINLIDAFPVESN